MNTIEIEECYGLSVCNRQAVVIERGKGNYVWDQAGGGYLDFTSGWGVTCLGHAHPIIVDAISAQARKIIQNPNSGFTYSPARAALLLRLQQVLPKGLHRVFFANSGAEANDAAIKLARKITGRTRVIAAEKSFHGRTLATLSVTGGPENSGRYLPIVPGNVFVPYGDLKALRAALDNEAAAVILEPIQGEGGVRIPPPGYLQAVAQLCKANGTLLIIDEVQTGFCRTGTFFTIDSEDIQADIMTMGKGIAGGLPFAAFAVSDAVAAGVHKGDHGGTYCGNPLACAVADAVIAFLQNNDIAAQVTRLGRIALEKLQELRSRSPELIREVRGKGLLLALDVGDDELVTRLTERSLQRGLLVTPTRNGVVRLLPGLLLKEEELEMGIDLLEKALSDLAPLVEQRLSA